MKKPSTTLLALTFVMMIAAPASLFAQGVNPTACAAISNPPNWCSGSDIGAWTNHAIAQLPSGCGEVYIPAGTYPQTTSIVKPRCVNLRGASGYGTVLGYTPTSGCSIVVGDSSGGSTYPPGAVEDLRIVGPGSTSTTCGIYMGGSDGSSTAPSTAVDPAANFGDHANINRLFITQFGMGVQYGYNTWRDTLFETVITSNGAGVSMPAIVASSTLSGENMAIVNTSIQNNAGVGLFVGTGLQVNFNVTDSSFDNNGPTGCTSGLGCSWQIQNGTSTSQNVVAMKGGYITAQDHWIQNFGTFHASGNYVTGGQSAAVLGYLVDNENAANFTVNGGQWFDSSTTTGCITNPSGQLSSWYGVLTTAPGACANAGLQGPIVLFDRFGTIATPSTVFARNAAITGTVTATGFSSNQAVTFTIQAAAGTGATTPVCAAGFACTPNYGSLTFTSGSAALAVGDIVKVSWTNVFLHKSVCVVQGVDNTASGTVLTTLAVDGGSATTTAAFFYTSTPLAASHSIGMDYVCF
jgi:hypothetical protein